MTVATRSAVPERLQGVSERTRALLTQLNLYYAVVGALALVCVYLLVNMLFAWRAASSQNADAIAQQTIAMRTAEIAKKPLEGLDAKLAQATADADKFSAKRLPFAYSEVAAELGALAKKHNVKLTRVQYAESPVLEGGAGALTEVRMDASLSGDYRQLVQFINELERNKMFFLIEGVTLTGQQSGTVGLRLRLTTYLRPPVGAERSAKTVTTTTTAEPASGGEPR
ncbi:MAG TPA: GspMb/PilO family protein [Edaphobacter sp.]